MQIGEFAKICKTRISVLRHYDKLGLLPPAYTDPFTGYRYYASEQIAVFHRIAALKQAGFSLSEIAELLATVRKDEDILCLFDRKEAELTETLENLKKARKMILEGVNMIHVIFKEENGGITARSTKVDGNDFNKACEQLEEAIAAENYQRVSGYRAYGEPMSGDVEVVCDVVKLEHDPVFPLAEDIALPFENDEAVIGKWAVVGQYAVKEDFYSGRFPHPSVRFDFYSAYGDDTKYLYFLPDGEHYWCYAWTKGAILADGGDGTSVNPYEIEEYDGEHYMFVLWKSYYYISRGGKPVTLVLKQIDDKARTKAEISRSDNIDLPFENDVRILGKWNSFSFIQKREHFSPDKPALSQLYWRSIEFAEGGHCTSVYDGEVISGDEQQVWTKGYLLRRYNQCACAYEIVTVEETDYLIIEWKSGDYRFGGYDTDYYVFVRA